MQRVAEYCGVFWVRGDSSLQRVAVWVGSECESLLQCVAVFSSVWGWGSSLLQRLVVCCSVFWSRVIPYCGALQRVAVCLGTG